MARTREKSSCWASLVSMKGSPRELWCAFVLKVLESYAYFSLSLNFTIYLSDEHGLSDQTAGFVYGIFGFAISFMGLLSGVLIDYLGVKWALTLGALVSAGGRLLFCVATAPWVAILAAVVVMPLGMAFGIPVLVISIKRSTTPANRPFAFSLFYACMNVAALVSGPATDLFRYVFKDGITMFGFHVSSLRALFLTGVVTSLLQALVAGCGMREINVNASGELEDFKPKRGSTCAFLRTLAKDRRFWRLTVFTLFVIAVRTLFRHLDATFPKYLTRELGKDAAYGLVYAINPTMILLMVPVIGAYTSHVHPFNMVLRGSFVSAASAFFLCIGAYYWTAILFVVTLSLGEAVYSPSVYTYTMMLSPKGREGLYAGLANAPMFVAKLFVGGLSGVLLAGFCPEDPPRRCGIMWLIIGVIAFSSPVMMLLTRNFIEPDRNKPMKEEESDDDDAEASVAGASGGAGAIQMRRLKGESLSHRLMSNDVLDQDDGDEDDVLLVGTDHNDDSAAAGRGTGGAVLASASGPGASHGARQRLASTDSDTAAAAGRV